MPQFVREHPEAFAEPVAINFNEINNTVEWPDNWKREFLTIIPKNPNPTGLAECRNISCTALLSKALENQV